ncbi:MAG: hemerythrin domain-containing protein [Planctomycetes bacterium]|nr:hemerythrin domain-containing protein [Planctomycetota bacterium]
MDIFDVLTSDHEKVKKILEQMEQTTPRAAKRRETLLENLSANFLPHAYAEEQYFYQILLDESSDKEVAYQALEEHRAAKAVLMDLEEAPSDDPRWSARLKVLKELIEHHIEEEETTVFDLARSLMDEDRATEAAHRFKELKKEAPAHAI